MPKTSAVHSGRTDEQLATRFTDTIVASLHKFGYPHADNENVFTDHVYAAIFRQQLKDGLAGVAPKTQTARVVESLIAKIDANRKES